METEKKYKERSLFGALQNSFIKWSDISYNKDNLKIVYISQTSYLPFLMWYYENMFISNTP